MFQACSVSAQEENLNWRQSQEENINQRQSQEEETASPVKTVLGSLSRASAPIHLVSIKTYVVGFASFWKYHQRWSSPINCLHCLQSDMEFDKKFSNRSFWVNKITKKTQILRHAKMFWNGIKPMRSTCFSHFTVYFNISSHILSWMYELMQKVWKLLRKYIDFRNVFWKNHDTKKKIPRRSRQLPCLLAPLTLLALLIHWL